MNVYKLNNMQEAYDNMECSDFDEGYQSPEQIDYENEEEKFVESMRNDAKDQEVFPLDLFLGYMEYVHGGNTVKGTDLLSKALYEAVVANPFRPTAISQLFDEAMKWSFEKAESNYNLNFDFSISKQPRDRI